MSINNKHNQSFQPKRFSLDANSLMFDYSTTQVLDENEKIDQNLKEKIKEQTKWREDSFLSEFLKS